MTADHEHFMRIAIEEAKAGAAAGEQPFGAVVARDGKVVCQTRSLKVSTSDTTAHSELLAIKCATQKLQQRIISDCTFYATCEPCPMCLGSVFNAGINTLVLGGATATFRKRRNSPSTSRTIRWSGSRRWLVGNSKSSKTCCGTSASISTAGPAPS